MITLKKSTADFKILNLTDIQFADCEWTEAEFAWKRAILTRTVNELVERVKPDLITISGDHTYAENYEAYRHLADYLDSFGIPWAPLWGNHDHNATVEASNQAADIFLSHPNCLFEKGDPALGMGNYVIAIEENGKPVAALLMMDTHDREPYIDKDGKEQLGWARLIPAQLDWYREQITMLKEKGCNDTVMVIHNPIYAYKQAMENAVMPDVDPMGYFTRLASNKWKPEYRNTVGVYIDAYGGYPYDDGVLEVIKEMGSTRHVICGHCHLNNLMIDYQGVKLIYSLKTGPGCYWTPVLNGGTVLTVNSEGFAKVKHEYVHED